MDFEDCLFELVDGLEEFLKEEHIPYARHSAVQWSGLRLPKHHKQWFISVDPLYVEQVQAFIEAYAQSEIVPNPEPEEDALPQRQCPACGEQIDFDYARCPACRTRLL